MKVSVVIPVYNVSNYIERCVTSLMRQTFTDVECLLIDDCTPDDSVARTNRLIDTYKGPIAFTWLSHQHNQGLSAARNSGIRAASGEYLFFLDGDDELPVDSLENLIHVASQYPDAVVIQGSALIVSNGVEDNRYQINKRMPDYSSQQAWISKNMLERKTIPVTSWNKLICRDWMVTNALFFREGVLHEDELWTYLSAPFVSAIAFCKPLTYRHYVNEGSIMRSAVEKSIQSWFVLIADFIAHQNQPNITTQRRVILEVSFCNLIRIVKNAARPTVNELVQQQRQLMEPFRQQALDAHNQTEVWLLKIYTLPLPLLTCLCTRHIRGIYFHALNLLPD